MPTMKMACSGTCSQLLYNCGRQKEAGVNARPLAAARARVRVTAVRVLDSVRACSSFALSHAQLLNGSDGLKFANQKMQRKVTHMREMLMEEREMRRQQDARIDALLAREQGGDTMRAMAQNIEMLLQFHRQQQSKASP